MVSQVGGISAIAIARSLKKKKKDQARRTGNFLDRKAIPFPLLLFTNPFLVDLARIANRLASFVWRPFLRQFSCLSDSMLMIPFFL